jgi:ABC-type glycerol-3-phosphate transport system substrate-binding protein
LAFLLAPLLSAALVSFAHAASGAPTPVELKLWIFLDPEGTDPRGKALKKIVQDFNASHPGIRVVVESIHWTKIDALAIQAAATGSGPDIINIYTNQLAMHVAAGTIQPMNRHVEPWLKQLGKEYSFPTQAVTFDGKIMSLPWELRVFLLLYRKDALQQAGLAPPRTLDELAQIGGKLRQASGGQKVGFALGLSEKQYGAQFTETFIPLIWGYGGRLFDDKGKAAFAGPEGVKAMQWIYDAVNKHGGIGREGLNMGADDVTSGLQAGTILMAISGSMRVAAIRTAAGVGDNVVTAPIPGLAPDKPLPAHVAGQTLAIGKNTKHPDAVWEFVKYYLGKPSQLAFAAAAVMPVLASAYDDPVIARTPQGPELKAWMEYARDHGKMERLPEDYTQLSEMLAKAAQQIVYANGPIKQTLEKVAADYNALRR